MPRLLHHVLRAAANDAAPASLGFRCSSCGSLFCEHCDELLHDSLHACPGCDGICKQERGEEDPGNGKIGKDLGMQVVAIVSDMAYSYDAAICDKNR